MNIKLFAATLFFALATPAFAEDDAGIYLVGSMGKTSNISNVDNGDSLGGLIGYQFSPFFSVEGGMVLLADKAKYIVPPAGYMGGPNYTSTSLAGTEFAGVIGLPMNDDFSILLRLGYTSMERSNTPSPAEVEVAWKGSTYGVSAQYMLPYEFNISNSKLKIGLRAGYNKYNLTDTTGLLKETPSNAFVGGVIMF